MAEFHILADHPEKPQPSLFNMEFPPEWLKAGQEYGIRRGNMCHYRIVRLETIMRGYITLGY